MCGEGHFRALGGTTYNAIEKKRRVSSLSESKEATTKAIVVDVLKTGNSRCHVAPSLLATYYFLAALPG